MFKFFKSQPIAHAVANSSFSYDLPANFTIKDIDGRCYADFRLSEVYKGATAPFGFDWFRTGLDRDVTEWDNSYYQIVGRQYDPLDSSLIADVDSFDGNFVSDKYMVNKLADKYYHNIRLFPIPENCQLSSYLVPTLSIFSQSEPDAPKITANLILKIHITNDQLIKDFRFEYDQILLDVILMGDMPTSAGEHVVPIAIQCKKSLETDNFIKLIAIDKRNKERVAGLMRVNKNAAKYRKSINVTIVKVSMPSLEDSTVKVTGNEVIAKSAISTILSHALITANIDIQSIEMDTEPQRVTEVSGKKKLLTYDLRPGSTLIPLDEMLLCKYKEQLSSGQRQALRYGIVIFILGVTDMYNYDEEGKGCQASGFATPTKGMAVMDALYRDEIVTHEMCHILGLDHSFSNFDFGHREKPFVYHACKTDNLMDYSERKGINLWRWQWEKLNTSSYLKNVIP